MDDIPAFLQQIDIFVLPSRYEGFGIALIEALASGIPVIASDIDGPREIFDLARTEYINIGELATCGDSESFSDKVNTCISNYHEYDKIQMRSFVEKYFSMDSMVKEHLKAYELMLKLSTS